MQRVIPREELFKNSPCLGIKISPDGKRLAFVGADREGTMNLYLTSGLSLEKSEQLTSFEEPKIKGFYWLPDNRRVLLLKDKDGTGQFRLYVVDVDTRTVADLTAEYGNINAKVFCMSHTENKAVIGINDRNPRFHDLYLLDLDRGSLSKFYQNDAYINFLFDAHLKVALKIRMNEESSVTVLDREEDVLFTLSAEEAFNTEYLRYSDRDQGLYLLDNRGCNTTQLKKVYKKGGKEELLGQDPYSDINDVLFEEDEPVAYTTYYTEQTWHPLTERIKTDLDLLISQIGANFEIVNQSRDHQVWIVKNHIPDQGIEFWLYKRLEKSLSLLYAFPQISHLSKMYPLVIPSRDGLQLVSYLTLPRERDEGGRPKNPLPLVIVPHGGPFKARDYFRYSPYHQWLANRGYAVLSVNFRLSSGFGKEFVNAGNGQWGKKAHQDILDAAQWCIDRGIADSDKIAVLGGSYGGYEALASLTFSPDKFACAVAICAPSSLKTVLDGVPFYWEAAPTPFAEKMSFFTKNAFIISMGGHPDKEEGIAYLQECSPLHFVDRIQKPLLLVHGANDPIVAASESDQIFEKMCQKQLPVTYLSFPDEGHGMNKMNNLMCCLAYSERLLARFLGGTYEPISLEKVESSSAIIRYNGIDFKEGIDAYDQAVF